MSDYYIVPARKGSKGFPLKNRSLFQTTANELVELKDRVIITSDDPYIKALNSEYGYKYVDRPSDLALDTTSIKDVLQHVVEDLSLNKTDNLILLYLTYPERTIETIKSIVDFYKSNKAQSLLCKEPLTQHPYLCFFEEANNQGSRIVSHNLYRRQDYPNCFFGSHFVAITSVGFLKNLDNNLHHPNTLFYSLPNNKIDIDYEADYINFKN